MAAEMEQEHRNENYYPDPIFFRKKRFTNEIKQELEKLKNNFEVKKIELEDLWQATEKVVKERHETNLALNKSLLLQQDQDPVASTSDASSGKGNTASEVKFGPETRDEAVKFYKLWIEEFKKNASRQRGEVRELIEKWFDFLHRFDDEEEDDDDEEEEEEKPEPKQSPSESPKNKYLYYISVLFLFVVSVMFIFEDCNLLKCNDELLVCLHEITTTLAFKIRNFYFKFHNITVDCSNISSIGHLSEVVCNASET